METALLKSFATWARRELITQVSARLTAVLAPASPERVENQRAVTMLERDIAAAGGEAKGKDAVADKVAYTWFNRVIALRFMDVNGYTPVGIVSPAHGQQTGQPEILADAKRGSIDPAVVGSKRTLDRITGLLDGTHPSPDSQGEAYTLLLAEYCRYWNRSMPFMFKRETDYTELLIPANLLAAGSILARASAVLSEEVCRDVEVIGWLYQFYISERKDEVFAGFKKGKKAGAAEIPAATQLFTPHWIVRYLVENSLGRLWMLNHPFSRLIEQMDYYIAPLDEETDFLTISSPEELKIIDPACGSGHMLTYAFDLLYAIYEEEGYTPSQIPSLILTNNLYGTEIDQRAGALAAFALTMKAAAKRKAFLKSPIEPNVCVFEPVSFSADELSYLTTEDGDRHAEEAFWNQFAEADTFGSLIQPDPALTIRLARHLATLDDGGGLLRVDALDWAQRVINQATYLTRDYAVVVANPPYMGSKQMNTLLSQFMKDVYPTGKADLFAGFIARCTNLAGPRGTVAMITMQSWMFLSSYEKLRSSLLTKQRITSMLHLGARAFDSIGGEVVSSTAFVLANMPPEARSAARKRPGTFIRLVDGTSEAEKVAALTTALEVRTRAAGFHLASDADFAVIPGSPIVYWLSEKMRAAFTRFQPLSTVAEPRQGIATADNDRFLRYWWEPGAQSTAIEATSNAAASDSRKRWFPIHKGGAFRKWYGNHELVIDWFNDGYEIKNFRDSSGRQLSRPQNLENNFRAGITWTAISSGGFAARLGPPGYISNAKGPMFYPVADRRLAVLGCVNSAAAQAYLDVLSPTLDYSQGPLGRLPLPKLPGMLDTTVEALINTAKRDWDDLETSLGFAVSPLVDLVRESA